MNDFNNSKINYIVFKPKDLGENLGFITHFRQKFNDIKVNRLNTSVLSFNKSENKTYRVFIRNNGSLDTTKLLKK